MPGKRYPEPISTKRKQLAKIARRFPETGLVTVSKHMDLEWLLEAHRRTRKDGAVGVDGQSAADYEVSLEENLERLLARAKTRNQYRAPAVKRAHIPKGPGSETRPIGIPTFEDKILQRAVVMLLEPIFEQDFLDCSYGFRPGRGPHDALQALWEKVMSMPNGAWVLEADIKGFFDAVDKSELQRMFGERVRDGVIRRLIGKWLNAGVLEDGCVYHPETGTPQGGVISPLLANIYLHHVLDVWFEKEVRPRMRGECHLIRFADDCAPRRRRKEAEKPNQLQLCCTRDEGWPLGAGMQVQAPNRPELLRSRAVVVSVGGKGAARPRQVRTMKTNASEPLMTCRKRRNDVETGLESLARDEPSGKPAYWLGGVRHEGGVSMVQALVWNVGTCRLDAKGEIQAEAPRG